MITKAVIEKVISSTSVKIRIPIFNKAKYASGATPTDELPVSAVCTLPGCYVNPREDDIVIVAFEEDDFARPIIVGYLFTSNASSTLCDMILSSLIVKRNCILSKDTQIGNVSALDIENIQGSTGNLQQQINILEQRISALEV